MNTQIEDIPRSTAPPAPDGMGQIFIGKIERETERAYRVAVVSCGVNGNRTRLYTWLPKSAARDSGYPVIRCDFGCEHEVARVWYVANWKIEEMNAAMRQMKESKAAK